MVIVTNFPRFPAQWRSTSGVTGQTITAKTAWQFFRNSPRADLIIVNNDANLGMRLCALYLLFPFWRRPILGNDMPLRAPSTLKTRLTAPFKRFLLSRIDHFTLHFRDLAGYEKYFGIGPRRASYLPFKPNIRYRYEYKVGGDGDYVLCFGRSERDYDTFFQAMEKLPYPAAIPRPKFDQLKHHTSRFTYDLAALPKNVQILEDDGSVESLIRMIENARLVALPILGSRIAPSGLGTYLNAMLMGKCVILTEGVAASDVLTDEVLFVPPENADALAATIRRAWEDKELRERTAAIGRHYAESLGGEPELRQRVLDRALEKLTPNHGQS
jgi:glycosyltransferase involved in cell wall biosynthesis